MLAIRWPELPSLGEASSQLFVQAVVSVAPLSMLLLVALACGVPLTAGTPLALQVYPPPPLPPAPCCSAARLLGCLAALLLGWCLVPGHALTLPHVQRFAAAEVAFYVFYRWRLHQLSPHSFPPPGVALSTQGARRQAMDRSLAGTRDAKRFVSGWFKFAPFESIRFDNAKEWVAWSMFGCQLEQLPQVEQEEVCGYVRRFEELTGEKFAPGYNEELRGSCIRINLDPISARHRPILSYLLTNAAHCVGWLALRRLGFTQAQVGGLSYWHRSATVKPVDPPIVLLHGIGLGLVSGAGTVPRPAFAVPEHTHQQRVCQ